MAEVGFVDGNDASELEEEPRGFAGVHGLAMGGAGAGAVTGVAGRSGVCVLVDDGRDGADGLIHVEGGDVAGVGVCRGLAEGEGLAGLGEIQPREELREGEAVFQGDDGERELGAREVVEEIIGDGGRGEEGREGLGRGCGG